MSDAHLAAALEKCLQALREGASLEECLDRYPALRQQLAALLQTAARLQPPTPLPAMERGAKAFYRSRLMAEIRPAGGARGLRLWPRLAALPAVAAALAVALVLGLGTTQAPDSAEAATLLTVLQGEVTVESAAGPRPGHSGMAVRPGDRIVTGADARAVLMFVDGSSVTLEGGTVVHVRAVAEKDGVLVVRLEQTQGQTWTFASRSFGQARVEIETPNARLQSVDAAFTTAVDPAGWTQVLTKAGAVDLESKEQRAPVRSGEFAQVDARGAVSASTAQPARELRLEVRAFAHVLLTGPGGGSIGSIAPGVPLNHLPGASVQVERDHTLVRIPEPAVGAYTVTLKAVRPGKAEVFVAFDEQHLDSVGFEVQAGEDWMVAFFLGRDGLTLARVSRVEAATPVVAVPERALERAIGTATAATAASPSATRPPERPTSTSTSTPTVVAPPTREATPTSTPALLDATPQPSR